MTSATDNRTTERLMALLEERGVKHELEHDLYVEWVDARGNDVTAFETSCKHKGDVLIVHVFLTPEQAIAATLGVVDKGAPQGADGNLDQAQIDWLRYMPDGWDGTAPTLGRGTCKLINTSIPIPGHDDASIEIYECSECNERMFSDYNYCPNCGAEVVSADD